MASSPTTSWHIDERKVETVTDFIFLVFKNTKDLSAATKLKDTCSLEGRKAMKNMHSVLKKQRLTLIQKSLVSNL